MEHLYNRPIHKTYLSRAIPIDFLPSERERERRGESERGTGERARRR